ncbi:MAG: hypothetical protein JJU19_07255 [Pararhodobacter sp.]|nr:hypothetical protein [Pararhodobacter sp.]
MLQLERRQLWFCLAPLVCGLVPGKCALGEQGTGNALDRLLWPLLSALIFVTFTQVPLATLPLAVRDRRFMGAVLTGNFIPLPMSVAALLPLLPADPAIRLGVALVLLSPCGEWYVTFTHLAGGDTTRAIAATPVNLLAQMVFRPVWLWVLLAGLMMVHELRLAVLVIVLQSLVELFGMLAYLKLVPRLLPGR